MDKTVTEASGDGIAWVGEELPFTFQIVSTGNTILSNVEIKDPRISVEGLICADSLRPQNVKYQLTYTVTERDAESVSVVNVATVSILPPGSDTPIMDKDDASIPVSSSELVITKVVSDASGDNRASEGEELTCTFSVTNFGNEVMHDIEFTDEMLASE